MFFLPFIFLIGVVTSLSDLRNKKIYNQHLTIAAVLSIMAIAYATVFMHEDILFHIINGGAACLISFLLFRSALWKGGDAKLFMLYALIMPAPYYHQVPFSSPINLFACSFIIGMIILSPVFIKDMIINYRSIAVGLFSIEKRRALFQAMMQMFAYSWVLYPLYHLVKLNNPLIILMISYFIFNGNYYLKKDIDKHYIIELLKKAYPKLLAGIVLGILLRLWLSPSSLSYPALKSYFMMLTLSGLLSIFIRTIFDYFKDYEQRIPFAPMLFMGCILSYTPFLTEIIQMMARWNLLFS